MLRMYSRWTGETLRSIALERSSETAPTFLKVQL